ncbi:MAG: PDZ domain-containing protein, partial [Pseudomonadota bacterium]
VNSPAEMKFRMSVAGVGGTSLMTRLRGQDIADVEVALIKAPDTPAAKQTVLSDKTVLPELTVSGINPAVIAKLGLRLSETGVVVVDPGPYGARAGLRAGDVLDTINDTTLDSPDDVVRALTDPGRRLRITIRRDGRSLALRFRL